MADSPPGSGIPIVGPVIDALTQIFSNQSRVEDLANAVDKVETNAWTNTLSAAGWAFGLFGGAMDFLGKQLDWLKNLLKHVLLDVIYKHIKALFDAVRKWITNLHNWIKVHVATLQKIQKQLNDARMKELKRVIDLIQRIRKVLVIFRIFHLKFAQKLDQFLSGIEGRLIGGVLSMARKTNEILGWIDVFGDYSGFHNSKWLWGSIGRDLSAFAAASRALELKQEFPRQLNQVWTTAPASKPGPAPQL